MTRLARIAVAGALLALIVVIGVGLLGGQGASAAGGTVNFDVDPEITGNTANSLGTTEECHEITVDPGDMGDATADYTVDVIVTGDTQAPTSYAIRLNYGTLVDIATGTDMLIKTPVDNSVSPPDPCATVVPDPIPDTTSPFNWGCAYLGSEGPSGLGIPGDGTIARLALAVQGSGLVTFSIGPAPFTGYQSNAGIHPVTTGTGQLAINQECPDSDDDGFSDSIESYLGTDPLDNCSDEGGEDDAWPLDNNKDTYVTVIPDIYSYRGKFGSTVAGDPELQRLDLNGDGALSVVADIGRFYRGLVNSGCDGGTPHPPPPPSQGGPITMDLDPEITGNSAATLGTIEQCVECDVDVGNMGDGSPDCIVDVVVQGDTQAPTAYDVSLNYDQSKVHIATGSTDLLIKTPVDNSVSPPDGCSNLAQMPPDSNGMFYPACAYLGYGGVPGEGIPGDGTLVRLGLAVMAPGVVDFSFNPPPFTAYASEGSEHPVTLLTGQLAINTDCPGAQVDLSADSEACADPTADGDPNVCDGADPALTDLDVGVNNILHVDTTGTHTNAPLTDTVDARISHTVTVPPDCIVDGGAQASDSWTGDLAGGASHVLSTDFTIRCLEPSSHTFFVENEIELLEPGYDDPTPANNTDQEPVDVNVWTDNDVDISGFSVVCPRMVDSNGDTILDRCVADVSTPLTFSVEKDISNVAGAKSPATSVPVNITKTVTMLWGTGTVDADLVTPGVQSLVSVQRVLPLGTTAHDEQFEIHCDDSNVGKGLVFAITNTITIKDPHIEDPDGVPAAQVTIGPVIFYCAPRFEPTFSATIDEDDGSGSLLTPVDDVCILGLPCNSMSSYDIPSDTPKQPLALLQTIYPAALDVAHGTTTTNGYVVGRIYYAVELHIQGMTNGCATGLEGSAWQYDACMPNSTEPTCPNTSSPYALYPGTGDCATPGPAGWCGFIAWPNQLNSVDNFVQAQYPGAVLWARYVAVSPELLLPSNMLLWNLDPSGWLSIGVVGNPDYDLDGLWDEVNDPDNDNDGVLDDGDRSGSVRNNPCTGGATANCDDNCQPSWPPYYSNPQNPDQADADSDGVGDVCDPQPGVAAASDRQSFFCSPFSADILSWGEAMIKQAPPPHIPSGEVLRTCEVFGEHTVVGRLNREDTGEATMLQDTITCISSETDLEVALLKDEAITVPKDLVHTETVTIHVDNLGPAPDAATVELVQVSTDKDKCVSHLAAESGDTLDEWTDGNQYYSKLTFLTPNIPATMDCTTTRDYTIVCSAFGSFPNIEQFLVDVQPITMEDTDPADNTDENFVSVDSDPDVDDDTILNADDACPFDPEDFDGIQDEDGCPETDADGDGILDEVDACPEDAEDLDGIQDEDGCPETDADSDGMPDGYEQAHACLNPLLDDAAADPDGDGLTNIDEMDAGTDPCDDDSDGDTFADGQELSLGSDPLNAASTPEHISLPWTCTDGIDNDLDSLPDLFDCDTDGDGIANYFDACPFKSEDMDDYQDDDGCPDADNDMDGICDPGLNSYACSGSDGCRNVAEDVDSFHDTDGCPDPDNDNDGFPDHTDQCPATDWTAGPDGFPGSLEDVNGNGILDPGEDLPPFDGVLTHDDPVMTWEDYDGVIDTDGCHDSPGDDWDGDGMTDEVEVLVAGTNPTDMDTDNDGLCDGHKPPVCGSEDLNNNGVVDPGETDPTNPDSDGDGLSDGLERGLTVPETPDTDTSSPNWQPDADPASTTDPLNPDSDGDSIDDGAEDPNQNGSVDAGETAPGDDDTDDDVFLDAVELYLETDPTDACPDGPTDDAWPLDINMDTYVTVIPDIYAYRGRINSTGGPPPDPNWWQRLDLSMDGWITVIPDIYYFRGHINIGCT